ncbi:hypothetical protein GL218_06921 [Daldinia childiae]|uniref:uncharacterized protein n=1 Tax=Daldinia childiae TaxID=326645 RepID=UPI0014474A4A|nr:uncharacterized protein GL218_06921 [Daldinia childiae]KAF3055891.1 hypothetical protein GL218_06921 [Daldinia childiae]
MDPISLGVSVGAIVMAFKGVIDTALLIESFHDDGKTGCGYLALTYHIEKTRLDLWGQLCKANNESSCTLSDRPDLVKETITRILGEIVNLNREAEKLITKHDVKMPEYPQGSDNPAQAMNLSSALPQALSKLVVKPKARWRWTIKGKADFEQVVLKIRKLRDDLESFTISDNYRQLLHKALPSLALKSITSRELLQTLYDPETRVGSALAASAKVKFLWSQTSPDSSDMNIIAGDQLRFLSGSSNLGILRNQGAGISSVWVEWNTVQDGAGAAEYIKRIKTLGYRLEKIGEPALRLPSCYGLVFQEIHGATRLGFVFGAPRTIWLQGRVQSMPRYTGDFFNLPPVSLANLMEHQKTNTIPLLGDRFYLAFTLAVAFSHFHAAGWLHKGFHSDNITFLQQDNEPHINVTDPFITGFQYSRPQQEQSLSRTPLENDQLQHYYHPDADKGFSRRLDLYSLGIVLCEIGRWGLIRKTVSDRRRKELVDRSAWRNYVNKYICVDMGWRMGEKYHGVVKTLLECRLPGDDHDDGLFEQQYLEKVIQPLAECTA